MKSARLTYLNFNRSCLLSSAAIRTRQFSEERRSFNNPHFTSPHLFTTQLLNSFGNLSIIQKQPYSSASSNTLDYSENM